MHTSPPTQAFPPGVTELSTLVVGPGTVRSDVVLQELERVRRSLARRWLGSPGAFTGYDRLQIQADLDDLDGGVMTFAAEVTEVRPTAHVVELVAHLRPAPAGSAEREIARGAGLTLHVTASEERRPLALDAPRVPHPASGSR